ncbi:hypothetical protein O1611_g825 [Lasiodiplodia mahajangana]|uniref:Uncharacterized protein n=1 Tax=Lasiodiplodia mahajangana TaxID=1108764 RepID=A0ACC2JZ95_9PEZI|nr:hypothetical protein O1611_g825 [Lasiodiplodia mahajangana]
MAEISGLIFGAASALSTLRGALDTALLIDDYYDDDKSNCSYLALRYHIQKVYLELWRQVYHVDDPSKCPLADEPEGIQQLVVPVLAQITRLLNELQKLVEKHGIESPRLPLVDPDNAPQTTGALIKALSEVTVKPKSKFLWTIKGKAEFEEKVSKINALFTVLKSLTVDTPELRSIDGALPSMSLKPITNTKMLQTLSKPEAEDNTTLAMSARAKLFQADSVHPLGAPVTMIKGEELELRKTSSNLGILKSSGRKATSVWIEWNTIGGGDTSSEYISRVKALGYLLEKASDPALHLPICYGIFDDLEYHINFKARRVGYVFGAPHTRSPSLNPSAEPLLPMYETNLCDHPPRKLSQLIGDKRFPIPLLGDRFALAFTLATSFSNFHSAGWLHKGFHTGNIIFLEHASSQEKAIRVTDPFIAGFQYARPTCVHSLSRGPLEDNELEYYYHPAAEKGFSRCIDLYSLGVVLCEIGRWALVGSTVRRKMADRTEWHSYLRSKVLSEMGWRMGKRYQSAVRTLLDCQLPDDEGSSDFFEREYFEKVIQPLSECSV